MKKQLIVALAVLSVAGVAVAHADNMNGGNINHADNRYSTTPGPSRSCSSDRS